MLKAILQIFALSLLPFAATQADDLADAANDLCEKVKSCAMAQMSTQELTPEMKQMMEPMLKNMCVQMRENFVSAPTGHPVYKPAVACMRSVEQLNCNELQSKLDMKTEECKEYEKIVEESGFTPPSAQQ